MMVVAPAEQQPVVVKAGCVPQSYWLSDYSNGEISHEITSHNFHIYPKGGCMMAFPPDGQTYTDCPGKDAEGPGAHTHHGPGPWRWQPTDSDAAGVEVCE